jgi:hypothetical protein
MRTAAWRMAGTVALLAAGVASATAPTSASAPTASTPASSPTPQLSTLPFLKDARQDSAVAQRAGHPLVILFSMPGCSYCPEVRDNYLLPLAREAAARPGSAPLAREVDITSQDSLIDFDGKAVESRQFSRRYQVKATPTVVFLDEHGQPLVQALVGSGMAGFYGAYLDSALETARQRISQGAGKTPASPAVK